MIRRPPRSTLSSSSAASDVYKRQLHLLEGGVMGVVATGDGRLEVAVLCLDDLVGALGAELEVAGPSQLPAGHGLHRVVSLSPGRLTRQGRGAPPATSACAPTRPWRPPRCRRGACRSGTRARRPGSGRWPCPRRTRRSVRRAAARPPRPGCRRPRRRTGPATACACLLYTSPSPR